MPWWGWLLTVWGVLAVIAPIWWVLAKPAERRLAIQQWLHAEAEQVPVGVGTQGRQRQRRRHRRLSARGRVGEVRRGAAAEVRDRRDPAAANERRRRASHRQDRRSYLSSSG